jgi:hypothetical protein
MLKTLTLCLNTHNAEAEVKRVIGYEGTLGSGPINQLKADLRCTLHRGPLSGTKLPFDEMFAKSAFGPKQTLVTLAANGRFEPKLTSTAIAAFCTRRN